MNWKKQIVVAAAVAILPMSAMAAGENNVGSCGWGSKLFEGQSGIFPQVMATWTNGTLGNQTFAISSGTSGCTQDGAVTSTWKTAMFIDGNKEKLARDVSRGQGDTLDSLAKLVGVRTEHKAHFYQTAKQNFDRIFPSSQSSTEDIVNGLKRVLSDDEALSVYTTNI